MRIPTILALAMILIALSLGVGLYYYNHQLDQQSKLSSEPKNIEIINITDNSASISWETDTQQNGELAWGETNSLGTLARDDRDEASSSSHFEHFATINSLSPSTTYFLKVRSGVHFYPDQPLQVKTAPAIENDANLPNLNLKPIIGKILGDDFLPIDEAIVSLKLPGATNISTITTTAGSFILPLVNLRDINLASFYPLNKDTKASLEVERAGVKSEAKILLPMSTLYLPPIVLGQNIDLTEIKASPSGQLSIYDLNSDGVINSLDLAIMLQNQGKSPKLKGADINGDGVVDQKDLDLLKKSLQL